MTFVGAADGVTGSMTWIQSGNNSILIDAGLHQGTEREEEKNFNSFPFKSKALHAVILTHAHLDHCGMLPRLVKQGFRGKIYCTEVTAKLARIILQDAAGLHEKSEDDKIRNFYGSKEAVIAISLFQPIHFDEWREDGDLHFKFLRAGHILGAASVVLRSGGKTVVFSGDLGRSDDPLMPAPLACPPADLVVMESTYGHRLRPKTLESDLNTFLISIKRQNKIGLVASFAVARAQMLLTLIYEFYKRHPEEKVRVFIDSPMMKEANLVYGRYAHETRKGHELTTALAEVEELQFSRQKKSLTHAPAPYIVISSSGMLTGGRIWHHLEAMSDLPNAVLMLPGYQGEDTQGAELVKGKRMIVGPQGNVIDWQGDVFHSEAFSSHADQAELLTWLGDQGKKVVLIHGEEAAKMGLKEMLLRQNRQVFIPGPGESIELS